MSTRVRFPGSMPVWHDYRSLEILPWH